MVAICEMCKLLNNPLRLEILLRTYAARDGMNVGLLADEMRPLGLGVSAVSQYLRQLERLGVVRRERAGRYVNYVADVRRAHPKVRRAVEAVVAAAGKGDGLTPIFAALMNPFRARAVAAVAKAGALSATDLCAKLRHQTKYLKRDLREAVDAGLLVADDTETALATYCYIVPADPTAQLLVSLVQ